jgi:hypothetical protein
LCLAAEMVLAGCVLKTPRQLASGKSSRAENGGGHRRKNDVLDFPTHGHSFFMTTFMQCCGKPSGLRSVLIGRNRRNRGPALT